MEVTVKLNSELKRYDPSNKGIITLNVEGEPTVRQVLEKAGIIRGEWEFIIINYRLVKEDALLKDGDIIHLYPIAGGG